MSYSCSDFTDDILNDLEQRWLLKTKFDPDDPSEQADAAMEGIKLVCGQRDELLKALRQIAYSDFSAKVAKQKARAAIAKVTGG